MSAATLIVMAATDVERLIDAAVQKALAGRQAELTESARVVSLDQAAKILHRRRADVLAMVQAGKLTAVRAGTEARPRWRIKVQDLRKVAP